MPMPIVEKTNKLFLDSFSRFGSKFDRTMFAKVVKWHRNKKRTNWKPQIVSKINFVHLLILDFLENSSEDVKPATMLTKNAKPDKKYFGSTVWKFLMKFVEEKTGIESKMSPKEAALVAATTKIIKK